MKNSSSALRALVTGLKQSARLRQQTMMRMPPARKAMIDFWLNLSISLATNHSHNIHSWVLAGRLSGSLRLFRKLVFIPRLPHSAYISLIPAADES
jgi:hypothetical protein